ncbi:MAG: radical SAM protein [Elusimicrobia bacterium]|nr:radical SAM protein [Elusimicrobiota bacterium]
MKIKDCAVKRTRDGFRLRHLTSSYRVRMNAEALAVLRSMLAKPSSELMTEPERLVFDRLSKRGIVVQDADPAGAAEPAVLEGSLLSTVELELSSACNLSCGHCFAELSGKHMPGAVLERALEGCQELEAVTLVLNGGEPLLSPFFERALRQARGSGMRVVVMTNGTLVTPEVAGLLAEQKAAKVLVSLDSFERHHDALRGPGSFQRAVAGIRLLVSAGVPVSVNAMATQECAGSAGDFASFCRQELGVSGVRFSALVPIGRGASAPARLGLSDSALKGLAGSRMLQDDALHRSQGPLPGQGFDCGAGAEQCFVAADGAVYACHYFQNIREPMGDLARSSLAEIHERAREGSVCSILDWASLTQCRACPSFEKCRGGCRARAKLLSGSFSAPDPVACRLHL